MKKRGDIQTKLKGSETFHSRAIGFFHSRKEEQFA